LSLWVLQVLVLISACTNHPITKQNQTTKSKTKTKTNRQADVEACVYLMLANEMIHELLPEVIG